MADSEEHSSLDILSQNSRLSERSELELEIPAVPERTEGKPSKKRLLHFDDLSSRQKKRRTEELMDKLVSTAEEEGISPIKLAAYLGFKCSYVSERDAAHLFMQIYNGMNTLLNMCSKCMQLLNCPF